MDPPARNTVFGVDLVGNTDVGSQRERISVGQRTVVGGAIHDSTGSSTGDIGRSKRGIDAGEAGIGHASILLGQQCRIVPANAKLECQLATHLPAILDKCAEGMVAQPRIVDRGSLNVVRLAQQEAGVGESSRENDSSHAVFSRILRLLAAEGVFAEGANAALLRETLQDHVGARLEGVIPVDPSHAGVRGRFDVLQVGFVEARRSRRRREEARAQSESAADNGV